MNSAPEPTSNTETSINSSKLFYELKLKGKDKDIYIVHIIKQEKAIEIKITDRDSELTSVFKISLGLDDFIKLNKYFRQFDTLDEIYNLLIDNDLDKTSEIEIDKNFAKFSVGLPGNTKSQKTIQVVIALPGIELNQNDIIIMLCQKVKEINFLKKK